MHKNVLDRFIKYCKFETTSVDDAGVTPSSDNQFVLARELRSEMERIGLTDVQLDDNCYLFGKLAGNSDSKEKIGFISHIDTSNSVSGKNVDPQIIKYLGGDIKLKSGRVIELSKNPDLNDYVGQDIVTSTGDTLLGCDDKGGIAIIMTAMEYLINHPEIPHGEISVAFTPDEEIGCGADHFDVKGFDANFAYTVDGGKLGEIEYENFNAGSAFITINGKSFHPGDSKNKMVNACLVLAELITLFPAHQTPATTEGYEGFYHFDGVTASCQEAKCEIIIRDHDTTKFNLKMDFVKNACDFLNKKHGENTVVCKSKESYYNMKEQILPHFHLVENAKNAMTECGIEPIIIPIRGGTDGSRLSFMGLPCPNISTGGHNFHGYQEYVPVASLEKMVDVVVAIAKKY